MTTAWLALAAALLLVPIPAAAAIRARALAAQPPAAPAGPGRRRWAAGAGRRFGLAGVALAGATLVGVGAGTFGAGVGVAAAIVVLTATCVVRAARAERSASRRREQVLAVTRVLVAELDAGARPAAALRASGDVAPQFRTALGAAARSAAAGRPVAEVLGGCGELAPLAHAWRLAEAGGIALAEVLDGVGTDLSDRIATGRSVAAAVAGARSSAGLLAGLPLLGVGLGAAMGAHPLAFLTGSGAGHLTGCAGVTLDAVGVLWTQRVVRRASRAEGPGRWAG